MSARRRRQGRARSSGGTLAALAVGAVLLLTGAYLQFHDQFQDQLRHQFRDSPPATTPAAGRTPQSSRSVAQTAAPPEVRSTAPVLPADPVRVLVPRLGVSAQVLAIRARGSTLIPPADPLLVGWWSDGARPGAARGSAVITGHTVHTGGGAFDHLEQLRAGDAVSVQTGRSTISYAVTSVTTYRKKALAAKAAQVLSQSVPGRLVLVTCDDWDGTTYLSNAVVIAVPTA